VQLGLSASQTILNQTKSAEMKLKWGRSGQKVSHSPVLRFSGLRVKNITANVTGVIGVDENLNQKAGEN
jgi:hypothetical protein